jgi:hypothetical protein
MSKKASVPLRVAPLQGVIAEPITDPAEQSAIDKLRKRAKRRQGGQKAQTSGDDARTASNVAAKKKGYPHSR